MKESTPPPSLHPGKRMKLGATPLQTYREQIPRTRNLFTTTPLLKKGSDHQSSTYAYPYTKYHTQGQQRRRQKSITSTKIVPEALVSFQPSCRRHNRQIVPKSHMLRYTFQARKTKGSRKSAMRWQDAETKDDDVAALSIINRHSRGTRDQ